MLWEQPEHGSRPREAGISARRLQVDYVADAGRRVVVDEFENLNSLSPVYGTQVRERLWGPNHDSLGLLPNGKTTRTPEQSLRGGYLCHDPMRRGLCRARGGLLGKHRLVLNRCGCQRPG